MNSKILVRYDIPVVGYIRKDIASSLELIDEVETVFIKCLPETNITTQILINAVCKKHHRYVDGTSKIEGFVAWNEEYFALVLSCVDQIPDEIFRSPPLVKSDRPITIRVYKNEKDSFLYERYLKMAIIDGLDIYEV